MKNFLLRLPDDVYLELKCRASQQDRSMNGQVVAMLRAASFDNPLQVDTSEIDPVSSPPAD